MEVTWGCRDGSTVKSTGCSLRGPEFNYQDRRGSSKLTVTPVGRREGTRCPLLAFSSTAHTWYIYIHTGNGKHRIK